MHTVVETPTFAEDAKTLWSEEERGAFCAWLAANPEAGDVIPGSGGVSESALAETRHGKKRRCAGYIFHTSRER